MADRFWVGGTANWDGTAGTKWSATSGGAGGASEPTAADDVFFNAASGAVTVTVTAVVFCRNLTTTGFTGTFAGSSNIRIDGSLTLNAGVTFTHTGTFQFTAASGSYTITTAGKTVGGVSLAPLALSTATWTLGDALTSSGQITVTQGTFTTNNFNVTATSLSSSNSNTRTINLGSSTITLTAAGAAILNISDSTGLTFNAGTSQINFTSVTTATLSGPTTGSPITFYNVAFTGIRTTSQLPGNSITGVNIFNNLAFVGPSVAAVVQTTFAARQTINGTLSTSGTAGNRRLWFSGATYGIAQTLTINSAPSLTDADFRDIYVIGTAAPISGTRIGDLRGCRGITFSTPKTVYWNLAGTNAWTANAWASTSGGTPNTDNFPLAQDIAVIDNSSAGSTIQTLASSTPMAMSTIDASLRTAAITLDTGTSTYYGDFKLGSGVTITGASISTFSGRNTQTITSAGKTFAGGITVDSYGGTVQLADALNIGSNTLTVTNGTFNTQNYNVTAGSLSSSNSNVRAISLGSSTVTLSGTSPVSFGVVNLTFNCGTSSIVCSSASTVSFTGAFQTFYDVSFTGAGGLRQLSSVATYRNLSFTAPSSAGLTGVSVSGDQTITGALTVAGATAVRRIFLRSDTLGTTRTLTVNSLSAQDCDFRDIAIAGAAAGSSPTRAGDCGGNTGITFPAPKTVYWNLAGTQNWSATAWAPGSGGTPALNNFPLAQDTAVFDNTGSVTGLISIDQAWNIGTFNASARTSAMTFNTSGSALGVVYGNWLLGTGLTVFDNSGTLTFSGRGTQTITSNGVTFGCPVTIACATGTVQLADALTVGSNRTLTLTSGTFDAVTYNVTTGTFTGQQFTTLKMGAGTWTLAGTGTVWNLSSSGISNFNKGTANIVLSNTTTTGRSFIGGSMSYNRLTIGGATGTSTLTISGNNQFTELASTKTVAHTIALGTTTQTFGAWTVTGTAGNVVTVTGTAALTIAGAAVSGVDYLALGTTTVSATSPGEFYAGANSTATGATAPLYLTAKPADSTRYWVGGSGNWSDTARWSTTSGTGSGASVPRSHDDVVFDSGSNATAYTATVNAVTGGIRCKALTIAGPASGNVTLAGSTAIVGVHGNVTLPATGLTRTYTGAITLSGSATGRTLTTNGVALSSDITVNGVNCGWSLGSAADFGATASFLVTNGTFDTGNYNLTLLQLSSSNTNDRTINFGSSTVTFTSAGSAIIFTNSTNLTFNTGTSSIVLSGGGPSISGGSGQTFYNVSFTANTTSTISILGVNTFSNLSFSAFTTSSIRVVSFGADQTITGTLTLSAGADATVRTFVQSNSLGTTRTLTCAAVASLTDIDFRDITIAGAAAPVSGTRLGDCKGNSGITFDAPKTVYPTGSFSSANWGSGIWSTTQGGAQTTTAFPLAQDTVVVTSTVPTAGGTLSLNANYNIGTIDMSARTSNTMTLAVGTQTPAIYGNWINGTGTTLTGTGTLTFAGRGSQTITSAGRTFTQDFTIATPSGSVTLQDAFATSRTLTLSSGTFNAAGYNATLGLGLSATGTNVRTLAIGSGTWTSTGTGTTAWAAQTSTNLTVTGTGTISLTSASAKTFAGGDISYSGITLDQGGAGTLTITGNNTFANITNSYKATGATTIAMGTTTQRVGNFTASGEAGRVLTVQGTSASSPATLVYTGTGQAAQPAIDYLTITGVRAYSLDATWYAGNNSTNNGSLGWYFEAGGGGPIAVFIIESASANSSESSLGTFNPTISELATGSETGATNAVLLGTLSESVTVADAIDAVRAFYAEVVEAATASDVVSAARTLAAAIISESAQGQESVVARAILNSLVSDSATVSDLAAGGLLFSGSVSEAAAAAEFALATFLFTGFVTESATAQDAAAVVASIFSAASAESAVAFDAPQGANTGSSSLSESASGSDSSATAFVASTAVSESTTAEDSAASIAVFNGPIIETATALDESSVAPSVFSAVAAAVAAAFDSQNAPGSIYNAALPTEGARASDSLIGAYLWNPIDDNQTPNWQNITNSQGSGWTQINTDDAPNWQPTIQP
jgi:hypothetical protein